VKLETYVSLIEIILILELTSIALISINNECFIGGIFCAITIFLISIGLLRKVFECASGKKWDEIKDMEV